jgi:hypothetical protein
MFKQYMTCKDPRYRICVFRDKNGQFQTRIEKVKDEGKKRVCK